MKPNTLLSVMVLMVTVGAAGTAAEELRGRLRTARPEQGFAPLSSETVGAGPSPQTVVPPASYSLTIDADFALGGFLFQGGHPLLHTDGGFQYRNTAVGMNALISATPGVPYSVSAARNTALGYGALQNTTTGHDNTASGAYALFNNSSGFRNTATGAWALYNNSTGSRNAACGYFALFNNILGDDNTASGYFALYYNTTGSRNVAVGENAGRFATTGNDNIFIANRGVNTDAHTIRIGGTTGMGSGQQNRTFIAGIHGITTTSLDAIPVLIDSNGQLGTVSSSRRVKSEIEEMGEASSKLLGLRPVTFKYKQEPAEGERPLQFGLVAEEVAAVLPELVTYDQQGRAENVLYRFLAPMLLNELQKQHRRVEALENELRFLRSRLTPLESGGDSVSGSPP